MVSNELNARRFSIALSRSPSSSQSASKPARSISCFSWSPCWSSSSIMELRRPPERLAMLPFLAACCGSPEVGPFHASCGFPGSVLAGFSGDLYAEPPAMPGAASSCRGRSASSRGLSPLLHVRPARHATPADEMPHTQEQPHLEAAEPASHLLNRSVYDRHIPPVNSTAAPEAKPGRPVQPEGRRPSPSQRGAVSNFSPFFSDLNTPKINPVFTKYTSSVHPLSIGSAPAPGCFSFSSFGEFVL